MSVRQTILGILLTLLFGCNKTSGQDNRAGDVKFIKEKDIILFDSMLSDTLKIDGVIRVTFEDSINLKPINTLITIFRLKGMETSPQRSKLNFTYFYSRDNTLTDHELELLDRYSIKIDSVFMTGKYKFTGENKRMDGNRLDFSYSVTAIPNN